MHARCLLSWKAAPPPRSLGMYHLVNTPSPSNQFSLVIMPACSQQPPSQLFRDSPPLSHRHPEAVLSNAATLTKEHSLAADTVLSTPTFLTLGSFGNRRSIQPRCTAKSTCSGHREGSRARLHCYPHHHGTDRLDSPAGKGKLHSLDGLWWGLHCWGVAWAEHPHSAPHPSRSHF